MGRGDSTLNALLCGKACACGSVSMVERGVIRQSEVGKACLDGVIHMRISVPLRQDIFDMSKAKCCRCKDLLLFWVVREKAYA